VAINAIFARAHLAARARHARREGVLECGTCSSADCGHPSAAALAQKARGVKRTRAAAGRHYRAENDQQDNRGAEYADAVRARWFVRVVDRVPSSVAAAANERAPSAAQPRASAIAARSPAVCLEHAASADVAPQPLSELLAAEAPSSRSPSGRRSTLCPAAWASWVARDKEAYMADSGRGGAVGVITLGGVIVIVGIVLMIVWSFWIGLIIVLVGLIAFGGFARGKWY